MQCNEYFDQLPLAEQLARVTRLWKTVVDRHLIPLGLTHPRWTVLWKLKNLNDHISQKVLADALEIELASLMRTLSQLEAQGLILRRSSDNDKRVRVVSFTDDGKTLISSIEQRILHLRKEILMDISETEVLALTQILSKIAHNASHKLKTDSNQQGDKC